MPVAWETLSVKTLVVDDQKRVQIPDAQPHEVFAYENHGGVRTLTPVALATPGPVAVRVEKRRGYSVGVSERPVSLEAIKEALADFP